MSTIRKTFKTKSTAVETRQIVEKLLKELPMLNSFISKLEWQGNKLCIDSKIGDGYIEVLDFAVNVLINLNFMGSIAKDQIESMLDKQFLQLEEKNK
jgi:hypothetical protein